MIRAVEWGLAGAAALGVHLAGFALWGWQAPSAGAQAAGAGGTALVTIAPADAALAAVIDSWDRPPNTAPDLPERPPQVAEAAPDLPAPDLPAPEPDPASAKPTAPLQPKADAAPNPDAPGAQTRPKPRPTPPAAPAAPAQQAAGQGGGATAGEAGSDAAATAETAAVADARLAWGAAIRARIEARKAYPRDGRGASGTVTLRLSVAGDGRLRGVEVIEGSGSPALDRAAVQAVRQAGRFARAPAEVGAEGARFTLPVTFAP